MGDGQTTGQVSPDFSWALYALRAGHKVKREGWNGKFYYLTFQKGYPDGIPINGNTAEAMSLAEGTVVKFSPYIMMVNTNTNTCTPWTPSLFDILQNDWAIYS